VKIPPLVASKLWRLYGAKVSFKTVIYELKLIYFIKFCIHFPLLLTQSQSRYF
jgi:hypothetical protein